MEPPTVAKQFQSTKQPAAGVICFCHHFPHWCHRVCTQRLFCQGENPHNWGTTVLCGFQHCKLPAKSWLIWMSYVWCDSLVLGIFDTENICVTSTAKKSRFPLSHTCNPQLWICQGGLGLTNPLGMFLVTFTFKTFLDRGVSPGADLCRVWMTTNMQSPTTNLLMSCKTMSDCVSWLPSIWHNQSFCQQPREHCPSWIYLPTRMSHIILNHDLCPKPKNQIFCFHFWNRIPPFQCLQTTPQIWSAMHGPWTRQASFCYLGLCWDLPVATFFPNCTKQAYALFQPAPRWFQGTMKLSKPHLSNLMAAHKRNSLLCSVQFGAQQNGQFPLPWALALAVETWQLQCIKKMFTSCGSWFCWFDVSLSSNHFGQLVNLGENCAACTLAGMKRQSPIFIWLMIGTYLLQFIRDSKPTTSSASESSRHSAPFLESHLSSSASALSLKPLMPSPSAHPLFHPIILRWEAGSARHNTFSMHQAV